MKRYEYELIDQWDLPGLRRRAADGYQVLLVQGGKLLLEREEEPALEPAPADDGWISVSERFPEVGMRVLCHYPGGTDIGRLRPDGWWECCGSSEMPSHWRPLPAPPQEVG